MLDNNSCVVNFIFYNEKLRSVRSRNGTCMILLSKYCAAISRLLAQSQDEVTPTQDDVGVTLLTIFKPMAIFKWPKKSDGHFKTKVGS